MGEQIVLFNDEGGDGMLAMIKVKNWDDRFETVVEEAREKFDIKNGSTLFDTITKALEDAGYETEVPEYTEILI